MAKKIHSTRLFYKFTAMFMLMALLVAATGILGLRQVNTVVQRLQNITQSLNAQEKMAILMKMTIQESRAHLLESLLYAKTVEQFEGIYVDYELHKGWFFIYVKRLLTGNAKLKIEPAIPGSVFELRVLKVKDCWNDLESVANEIRANQLENLKVPQDGGALAQNPQYPNSSLKNNLDDASDKVILSIDDLLVTISTVQQQTKVEILTIQHQAKVALIAASCVAIVLAILLGILVTRRMIINLSLIMDRLAAIAKGDRDLSQKLSIKSKDEIGDVATGINDMFQQLVERDREIEEYNNNLKGLVAERTQELSRANSQLSIELVERRKIEEDLVIARETADEANRLKSEFLANMSHEIRTPMNAILGFSELLEEHVKEPLYKSYLDGIQVGGKNLLNLINDILDLSKIEAGRLDIRPEVVNPYKLFNEVGQIFSVTAERKGLTLDIEISPTLPKMLIIDETRIRQILLNLVGNAIKFTHEGGITITVAPEEYSEPSSKITLAIAVTDSGIGIPDAQKDIIFEAFCQQEGQNTRKYGGTGLGLTICKRLVEMMHGTLVVTSEPGHGSTFAIRLPDVQVAAIDAETEGDVSAQTDFVTFHGQQILLAEDIESNRQVFRGFLESHNLFVRDAVNGQEAITMIREERPDLILMDIQMPVMDGYAALQLLKADPELRTIPVIALTASVMNQNVDKMRKSFDGYIRKPVSRHDLVTALAGFLAHDTECVAAQPDHSESGNEYRSLQSLRLPKKMAELLANELQERWNAIKELMMNDEVEEFGITLETLGNEYGIAPIAAYGKELAELAASFQLEKMESLFGYYQMMLQKIEIGE